MRKLRQFLALVILATAVGACSSPAGLDCAGSDAACINPGPNGINPGPNGINPGPNG